MSVLTAARAAKLIKQLPKSDFAEWYKASKLKTEAGDPLLLYHGTSKDTDFKDINVNKNGAWFSTKPEDASKYSIENDSMGHTYEGGKFVPKNTASRVIPAYVRAENPYTLSEEDLKFLNSSPNYKKLQGMLFDKLRAKGHDAVDFGGGTWAVIGDKKQIRSAILSKDTSTPSIEAVPSKAPEPAKLSPGWYVDDKTGVYHQVGEDGKPVPMTKDQTVREQWPDPLKEYQAPKKTLDILNPFYQEVLQKIVKQKKSGGAVNIEYKAKEIIPFFQSAFKIAAKDSTPSSRFFGNLFEKLDSSEARNTRVQFVDNITFKNAIQDPNAAAYYDRVDHTVVFPENTLVAAHNDENFMHYAMGHELAHGATVRKTRLDLGIQKTLKGYMQEMELYALNHNVPMTERDRYGFTNYKEFIAEVYARPQFRQLAKDAQVWNRTVLTLAGMLGLGAVVQDSAMRAEFEKTLEFNANGST